MSERPPSALSASHVEHTNWMPDGKPRAWCPECGWREKHDSLSGLNRLVVRHVRTTGHRVQAYRSQWKAVSTADVAPGLDTSTSSQGMRLTVDG